MYLRVWTMKKQVIKQKKQPLEYIYLNKQFTIII